MFERPLFWNGWSYRIKNYGIEVTFNGITPLLNFIKIYQLIQSSMGDREDGDLISLYFPSRKESTGKLKIHHHVMF
jgi:hypothetical protein